MLFHTIVLLATGVSVGYTDNTKEETTKQKKTVNQPKIQAFFK